MGDPLGLLKVTVVQGKRLVIRDFKSSDPYVVVKLGNQLAKTKVINSCLNPVWNEELSFFPMEPIGVLSLALPKERKTKMSLRTLVTKNANPNGNESDDDKTKRQRTVILGNGSQVVFIPRLVSFDQGWTWFDYLNTHIPWTRPTIRVFGRSCLQVLRALPGSTFNSLLLNRYKGGNDYVAWHSDDEKVYGSTPEIASLSFGCEREFFLKKKGPSKTCQERRSRSDQESTSKRLKRNRDDDRHSFTLKHGSLLVMRGYTQRDWMHSVPKRTKLEATRINLTFRNVL